MFRSTSEFFLLVYNLEDLGQRKEIQSRGSMFIGWNVKILTFGPKLWTSLMNILMIVASAVIVFVLLYVSFCLFLLFCFSCI